MTFTKITSSFSINFTLRISINSRRPSHLLLQSTHRVLEKLLRMLFTIRWMVNFAMQMSRMIALGEGVNSY
ncbi:hypothetical protein QYF36_015610 [Acer negundo]|nr:hypothetical protein QYF36_015610 [Acer negundo]